MNNKLCNCNKCQVLDRAIDNLSPKATASHRTWKEVKAERVANLGEVAFEEWYVSLPYARKCPALTTSAVKQALKEAWNASLASSQQVHGIGDGSCDRCGAVPSIIMPTSLCKECADGVRRAETAEAELVTEKQAHEETKTESPAAGHDSNSNRYENDDD